MKKILLGVGILIVFIAIISFNRSFDKKKQIPKKDAIVSCSPLTDIDFITIEKITGIKGVAKNGEYKITIPQNDLDVVVDGFKIIPPMGLGTWIAFTPCDEGAMMMGDIVLTENDLAKVQSEVVKQGISITAIHNHFVRNHPNILYMHIDAKDKVERLSYMAKSIIDKVKEVRGIDPRSAKADSVTNTLNIAELDNIIGSKGEMNKGVYKHTIGRPDVKLTEHGIPISTFLGFNTWIAWQGTMDKAAVCGDITMKEDEVQPVINALINSGIEVVALHNHMVEESPKVFFLHYWGTGKASKLAIGLHEALNVTNKL